MIGSCVVRRPNLGVVQSWCIYVIFKRQSTLLDINMFNAVVFNVNAQL